MAWLKSYAWYVQRWNLKPAQTGPDSRFPIAMSSHMLIHTSPRGGLYLIAYQNVCLSGELGFARL